jgi:hypothetical protein
VRALVPRRAPEPAEVWSRRSAEISTPVTGSCTHEHVEIVSSGPIGENDEAPRTERALCSLCKRQVERHESGGVWTAWRTMHEEDAGT